jgi:hypothetical protein
MQRGKDDSRLREMHQKPVPCLAQMKEYSKTFHLIDKGNGKEAKYIMAGKSRLHNWSPKLVFCMFNMALNNAWVVFKELVSREGDGKDCLKNGQSSERTGAQLVPTGCAYPEIGCYSSNASTRHGST